MDWTIIQISVKLVIEQNEDRFLWRQKIEHGEREEEAHLFFHLGYRQYRMPKHY